MASFIDKHVFVEQFNFDTELKNTYPDHGTSVTIFGNNLFTELECLSPEKNLIIGEKITYDLSWSLQKIDNKNAANRFLETL